MVALLTPAKTPTALVEVATRLDIPKSNAHGLSQTLTARDLIVGDDMGHYRTEFKLFSLSANAWASSTCARSPGRPWRLWPHGSTPPAISRCSTATTCSTWRRWRTARTRFGW